MSNTKASSHQMEDPFLYAPKPSSKVQEVTQAGTRPSIHVSLYAYGGISAACMMSWVDLTATFARSDRQTDLRTIREDALISRSRCRATKWFLDSGKDVWVQLDHDIEFTAADIIRMAELAHEHQATVCIPYSCRSLPARPALRPKAEHLPAQHFQGPAGVALLQRLANADDGRQPRPPRGASHTCGAFRIGRNGGIQ